MQGRRGKGSRGGGAGRGSGSKGQQGGGGRMGGFGKGSGGECVCPGCGKKTSHERGVPCTQVRCPECGTYMTRGQ
jgi:hypothetical protein